MSNLLLISPLTNKNDPSKTGGIVVLTEDLISQCKKLNINFTVIDTNKANYRNKIIAYLSILYFSVVNISKASHVSLHGTAKDYMLIAPFVVFFSKLFGKKMSLRKFAGNFDILYDNSSNLQKRLIDYALKESDVNFFETKYLVDRFKPQNEKTYWFPNVRMKSTIKREGIYQKKFIFIGQVREEKGIREILEVSNLLDDSYTLDIYGKIFEDMNNTDFSLYNAAYQGSLNPEDVQETLCHYDVLLLPSYNEGYPGVIVEALSVGLPVVATNLRGIKEMVDNRSSILIDPKNVEQLKDAIESFDDENYAEKSTVALKLFSNFDSDHQTKLFFERIGFYA